MKATGASAACAVCHKMAYPMESVNAESKTFHKSCFSCVTCASVLSIGNYAALKGLIYCKAHYNDQLKNGDAAAADPAATTKAPAAALAAASTKPLVIDTTAAKATAAGKPASPRAGKLGSPRSQKPTSPISPKGAVGVRPTSPRNAPSRQATKAAPAATPAPPAVPVLPTGTPNVKNASCDICTQTVYAMDKISADGKDYHKNCFRCAECNNVLRLGNYAALEGNMYCKPHFKQLFAIKGNYDEGFGRVPHKMNWVESEEAPVPAK